MFNFIKKFFKKKEEKDEFDDFHNPYEKNLKRELQLANEAMYSQIQKGIPEDNEDFRKLVETQTWINNSIIETASIEVIELIIGIVLENQNNNDNDFHKYINSPSSLVN